MCKLRGTADGDRHTAIVDDLLRTEGKAELIGGRVVKFRPSGHKSNRVAFRIAKRLDDHVEALGRGFAYSDGMGFTVSKLPSGRESFCPDAAFYDGPPPANRMRFVQGPPTFAVEARSENDFGPASERVMAAKRADSFEAGTKVVWDVDPEAETVTVYRAQGAEPVVFARGHDAEAKPALSGWTFAVDAIFG